MFYSIIIPSMIAVSFLSNSTFIHTVGQYRRSELRTVINAYLLNMAEADLLYVEVDGIVHFVLPCMMSPVKCDVHYGQLGCFIHTIIWGICYYTSYVLITCVAVERFLAICHPLYQRMVSCKSRTVPDHHCILAIG